MIAVVLFSSIFIFSEEFSTSELVYVGGLDLQQLAQGQEATNANHAGVTIHGHEVSVWSKKLRLFGETSRALLDESVIGQIDLKSETQIDVTAKSGEINQHTNSAVLSKDVTIETSTGYVMETARLFMDFDNFYAESPGPVQGWAPIGDLKAGRMVLRNDATGENLWMRFSDGVELKFVPQKLTE